MIDTEWLDLKEASKALNGKKTPGALRVFLNRNPHLGRKVKNGLKDAWEIHRDNLPYILKTASPEKAATYEDLTEKWAKESRSVHELSPRTIEKYQYGLKAFWRALAKPEDLEAFEVDSIREAVSRITSPAVRVNVWQGCKSFYKFLAEKNLRPANALAGFASFKPSPNKNPRRTYLTRDEFASLLIDNTVKLNGRSAYDILLTETLAMLLFHTGMRREEAICLELKDIDRRRGIIYIRGENAKGGRDRRVGIRPELATQIDKYLKHRPPGPVFLMQEHGRPVTKEVCNHRIQSFGGKIDITPHGLRRSFITLNLQDGVPPALVRVMSGHRSSEIMDEYDMTKDEDALDVLRGKKEKPLPEPAKVEY